MNRACTTFASTILAVCGFAAGTLAQSTYLGGHEYVPVGAASASLSSDGRTLTLHNIGSSGQDGVELFTSSLFGAGVTFTRDGAVPPPIPGSSMSIGFRASDGTITASRTSVTNTDNTITHTFDYSALGAISVRVVRLDENGIEVSNQNFAGPLAEVTMPPPCPIGTAFYPWARWYDIWHHGQHIVGNFCDDPINPHARIIVTPTFAPGTTPSLEVASMLVTAANMPELNITEPGTVFGAAHVTGLGGVRVREECDDGTACDDAARRRVRATGIGSSGQDGISATWGGREFASSGDFTFDGLNNSGGSGRAVMRGTLGGGGGGGSGGEIDLSSLTVTDLGNGSVLVVPDFTGLGATEVIATAYSAGMPVSEIVIPIGTGVVLGDAQVVCGPGRVPIYGWVTEVYWNPWPIHQSVRTYWGVTGCGSIGTGGGNPTNYTDRVIFTPVNPVPVGSLSEVELSARDIGGISMLNETTPAAPCRADVNGDGQTGSQDFFDFIVRFFAGDADTNNDGETTSQDFFDFLVAFFAGC